MATIPSLEDTFGKVEPKLDFFQKFKGEEGLGGFLTALVNLIFIAGGIILILMFMWGALDWMLSGGEKDKVESARNKILNAVIGFIILAVTFAVIDVIGQFTGFELFNAANTKCTVDVYYRDGESCIHRYIPGNVTCDPKNEVFINAPLNKCP